MSRSEGNKHVGVPANGYAERGLVASLFAIPEALDDPAVAAVQPTDLIDPSLRVVFRHLADGWRQSRLTAESLPARITAAGEFTDDVRAIVVELLRIPCTGLEAAAYAGLIKDEADCRRLLLLRAELCRQIDDGLPPEDVRGFLAYYLDSSAAIAARPVVPLDQLAANYPELRGSVLNGLLREAEIGTFVSMSKVGKSWLAYSLGLCVQAGLPWLDRFSTRRGKVLLVDNELDVRTIAFRVPKVAQALGIGDVAGFHVHSLRGQLLDIFQLRRFFHQFKPGEYRLVILDALYRLWPPRMSENDNAAVTAVMNQVAAYAERMEAAFALVHHSSKGAQAGKSVVDVGAGAAALARAADTHVVLREHQTEGAVVLEARTRSWEPQAPMVLRWQFPVWNPATDLSPAALKISGRNNSSKPDRKAVIMGKVRDALVKPMTKNGLKVVGGSGTEINWAINYLLEEGEIEPCEVITRGGKHPGFQLRVGKVGEVGIPAFPGAGSEDSLKGSLSDRPCPPEVPRRAESRSITN